mmetsp:Transcript_20582/g.71188  ORF Transcript_20582/g.71188 Transcript_20582/m.71188 type:complete len:240 (-) Transcript_20582:90-809(-)
MGAAHRLEQWHDDHREGTDEGSLAGSSVLQAYCLASVCEGAPKSDLQPRLDAERIHVLRNKGHKGERGDGKSDSGHHLLAVRALQDLNACEVRAAEHREQKEQRPRQPLGAANVGTVLAGTRACPCCIRCCIGRHDCCLVVKDGIVVIVVIPLHDDTDRAIHNDVNAAEGCSDRWPRGWAAAPRRPRNGAADKGHAPRTEGEEPEREQGRGAEAAAHRLPRPPALGCAEIRHRRSLHSG